MITLMIAGGVCSAAAAVRWYLHRTSRRDVLLWKGWVELTEVFNTAAAFSLRIPKKIIGAVSALTMCMVWKERKSAPLAAGLLLGGGAANFWERLRYKKVYDYVRFPKMPGRGKHYVWNLADFAILAGMVGLLLRRKKS